MRLTSGYGLCGDQSRTHQMCLDGVTKRRRSAGSRDASRGHLRVDPVPGQSGTLRERFGTPAEPRPGRGHELIYGELLVGDRGGRRKLLTAYDQIHQASVVPHDEVVVFVRERGLHGRGVGWIDIHLLASAIVGRMPLWT